MKTLNFVISSITASLMIFVLFSSGNAQEIDLKEVKAQKEAESIKKFTDSLVLFYNLVPGVRAQPDKISSLKGRAEKIRNETAGYLSTLDSLVVILKSANRFNDQFDKDVDALLAGNKVKSRVGRTGGARKLLGSVSNSTAVNSLKVDVTTAAELLEFSKNEDVCKFLAVGIVTEAILFKKATTGNDKFYEQYGCK